MTNRFAHSRDLLLIACLAFIIYFGLALMKPSGIFWSLDEGGKWIYLENVLRTGDPRAALIYPGRELDPKLENVALFLYGHKGMDIYTWWPVGFPLMVLPFYKLLGWGGLYVLPALAGAVTVFFTGRTAQNVTENEKIVVLGSSILVGLTTPILYYSTTFWEHTLSVACLMASLALLSIPQPKQSWKCLFLAGVLASLAVFFRQEVALLFIGAGLVLLFANWRKAIPFAVGSLLTSLIWLAFNYLMLGHFLSPNQTSISAVSNFATLNKVGMKLIPYILYNSPAIGAFDLGRNLLILGTALAGGAALAGIFRKARLLSAILLGGVALVCVYVVAYPQLYRSVHGFVLIAPFVLLFSWVVGTRSWHFQRTFWLMMLGGMIVFAVVFIMRGWIAAGGLQWGPRYLLSLYPVLIISGLIGLIDFVRQVDHWQKIVTSVAVALSLMVGLGFEARGYVTMLLTMQLYQQTAQSAEALNDQIIATDCTWMPMVMPYLYWNGNIFTDRASSNWLEKLKQTGKDAYLDITLPACSTDPINQVMQKYRENPSGLEIKRVPVKQ